MPFFILYAQHKNMLHNKNGPVLEISNAYSAHGDENRLYWSSTFEKQIWSETSVPATFMKITAASDQAIRRSKPVLV